MKKVLFFLFAFVLLGVNDMIYAQSWHNFSSSNSGLVDNCIMTIAHDVHDNVWVGMGTGSVGTGINKFDGTTWTFYDSTNSGLSSNAINKIVADSVGNIWVIFWGGFETSVLNLTKFDGTTWTSYDTSNSNIPQNGISDIFVDKLNNVWLTTSYGVSKFDGNTFTNYRLDTMHISAFKIYVEDSTNIWLAYDDSYGTATGIARFDPYTHEIDTFTKANSNLPSCYVSSFDMDSEGQLWISFSYDFQCDSVAYYGGVATFDGSVFNCMPPIFEADVQKLTIDTCDNVWISTRCDGLFRYNGYIWGLIQGPPTTGGCSFAVSIDRYNYVWYTEIYSGIWTNNPAYLKINEDIEKVVKISPNPAKNQIAISGIENPKVEMFSITGQSVMQSRGNKINICSLPSGVYFLRINNNPGMKKIIKI
ncbi:MAG: T9SS type A sorting domain-containing protein [Bacteroidia bacterium]|nr:T9SS type A sorting domain-containing protein [Bacteroidia bacterium]